MNSLTRKTICSMAQKYVVEILGAGPTRTGVLETGDNLMKTPGFFTHTLAGSVPHLTSEVFEMVFPQESQLLQISVDTTYNFHENVKPSRRDIAHFVGYPKRPSFLTIHNPLRQLLPGFNDKLGISIWTRQGRQTLPTTKFVEIVNAFRPTYFQIMSDYDVTPTSSVKRIRKSTERSIQYLEDAIGKVSESSAFATVECAWFAGSPRDAESVLAKLLEKQDKLQGFVINPVKVTRDDGTEINTEVLSTVVSKLPANKPRFVPGTFTLLQILELINCGIDVFDSSLVTKMVEDGQAMSLELDDFLPPPTVPGSGESLPAKTAPAIEDEHQEGNVLDLKDKRYFDDFSPISKKCACYSCRKFTRSYVHHLLATTELLGPVLLMMHNLHQFQLFFQAVQKTLPDEAKFKELYNHLQNRNKV